MKQLLGVALILAIGAVVSARWFGRAKGWGRAHFFYLTGEEFLLVGLLLGPLATGVVDRETLRGLQPFVGLGLGYVGLVYGMQLRRGDLAAIPGAFYRASLLHTAATLGVLVPALWLALSRLAAVPEVSPALAVAAAATAVGTSTSFLFLVEKHSRLARSPSFRFLRVSSVLDDLWGVAAFGLALCWLRPPAPWEGAAGGAAWVALSLATGVASGGLLLLASRNARDDREAVLYLLGVALFSGGAASYLRLSPLLTNLVAGALFANASPRGPRFHDLLLRVEKPLYLFLLVLAGAMWRVQLEGVALLGGAYVAARLAGKLAGGALAGRVLGAGAAQGPGLGLGLTAQSEMGVAMMVNLMLLYDDQATRLVVSAVFAAVLVNDLLSSAYFSRRRRVG